MYSLLFPLARRLYPDISFFQRATEYPCLLILDPQNEFETLRKRVEQTTLKSQTVARNRSGVTNVRGDGGCPGTARDNHFLPFSLGPLATGLTAICPLSHPRQPWSCQVPPLPGLFLRVGAKGWVWWVPGEVSALQQRSYTASLVVEMAL